jgi:hypothetical protein
MAERIRIEIGFDGGQALTIVVEESSADDLQRAIGGDGSVSLEAEDGRYTVALRRVAYLRRFAREARVGFGTG